MDLMASFLSDPSSPSACLRPLPRRARVGGAMGCCAAAENADLAAAAAFLGSGAPSAIVAAVAHSVVRRRALSVPQSTVS